MLKRPAFVGDIIWSLFTINEDNLKELSQIYQPTNLRSVAFVDRIWNLFFF